MPEQIEITDEDLEAAFNAALGNEPDADDEGAASGDDQDADADGEDGEDDSDDAPEGWTPPTYQEYRALKAAKNEEAKKWRLRATGKDPEWKIPGATTNGTGDAATTADAEELRRQIRAELETEFATKAERDMVQKEAVTALVTAGLQLPEDREKKRKAVTKVMRLLELGDVTVDGDDVIGLDDAIEDLRADYPGLFKAAPEVEKKRRGRRVAPEPRGVVGEEDPLAQMVKARFGE
jgi:hypothetical protein